MAGNNYDHNGDDLDRYPEGDSALSASYRQAAAETPPRRLDQIILSAARKAVRAGKPLAFSPFASDWHLPVSLAAILVLSVALVMTMRREPVLPAMEEPILQTRPPAPAKDSGPAAAKTGVPGGGPARTGFPAQPTPTQSGAPPALSAAPLLKQEGTVRQAVNALPEPAQTGARGQGSGDQQLRGRQFITVLSGPWSGTAVTTPVGPVAYDIIFNSMATDCVTGTAHPGTHHTWTFCVRDGAITLDFLTDFRGNSTPIHFRQLAYNEGAYTFKADTHDFMEVLVFADESMAWMKIIHYGKLHVEIRLTRK